MEDRSRKIKWGKELLRALSIVGKSASKVLVVVFNVVLTLLLILAITGVLCACALAVYINNYVDTEIDETMFRFTEVVSESASELYRYDWTDRTNRVGEAVLLEDEKIYGSSKSILVSYTDLPEDLINAFIAIEDKRFRTHEGVDWIRTVSAFLNFFTGSKEDFGGSTLTQQLIKNVTGDDDYKIQRKIQEIFWALDLEKKMDKTAILTSYMNIVSLANGYTGVGAAAEGYFSKDVSELDLLECAAIACITKNPSKFDPIANPEENKRRREYVLWEMYDQGLITESEYEEVAGKDLVLNIPEAEENKDEAVNSWYVDMVITDVLKDLQGIGYTKEAANLLLYTGGLKIYTLVDPEVQEVLEKYYENDTSSHFKYTGKSPIPPQCSMIIIDPYTGDILGVAGARGEKKANRVLNFATEAVRPMGSTIKPISVYAPAFENEVIQWNTPIDDTPYMFNGMTGWPQNVDDNYLGLTTVYYSLQHSLNTSSIKTLDALTLEKSFDFLDNELNFFSLIESKTLANGQTITDKGLAALGLGQFNYGITLRELTGGYTMFPNNGVFSEPRSYLQVCDKDGNVILNNEADTNKRKVVISEETSFMMTEILKGVVDINKAFDPIKKLGIQCAGKTGTTGNLREVNDYIFVGYTPYYLGGVWYGFEYVKRLEYRDSDAARIVWTNVMMELHEKVVTDAKESGEALKTFADKPADLTTAKYCSDSGKLCTAACHMDPRGSREIEGYFVKGTEPTEYCDRHILVKYDMVNGGVAGFDCPAENIGYTALVAIERNFPIVKGIDFVNTFVADTEYTWRELPLNVLPYTGHGGVPAQNRPFFYNLTVNDIVSVGASSYSGVHYNRFASSYFNLEAWQKWASEQTENISPGE